MSPEAHTPGPWAWFGNPKNGGGFYLATTHSGRRYVMDFVRMGFNQAQPRFQVSGLMENASDLCKFEVADVIGVNAAKQPGSGVYRFDINCIDHPDARLIAESPNLLDRLQECEQLLARLFPSIDSSDYISNDIDRELKLTRAAIRRVTGKESA